MMLSCPHATHVVSESANAERAIAMARFRKKLANSVLGQDIDELCLTWHQAGMEAGIQEGIDKAVNDIVTDLLSDAYLSMEIDTELMQRIINIVEN